MGLYRPAAAAGLSGSVVAQLCVMFRSGRTSCNLEQFGQYPLQVNGFNDLYECLEGAMVEKDIESLHSDHGAASAREVNSAGGGRRDGLGGAPASVPTHTATVCPLVSAEMVPEAAAGVDL